MNRFRGVWAAPHVARLLVTSLVARLPYGINALAIILFVHEQTGSFARAGAVSAANGIAVGVGLPVLGRLVDRAGQTSVLVATAVVHASATAALIALGLSGAPTGLLAAVAAVVGFFAPPVSPCLRSLLREVLRDDEIVRSALALDAIMLELVFIGGPALTAGIVAVASPAIALGAGAAFAATGTLAFAATAPSRAWRGGGRVAGWIGPLRSPGLRTLLLASIVLGFPMGVLDVALPAFGVEEGSRSLGGLFIAAMAVGSGIAGIVYGARAPSRVRELYLVFSFALPAGIALLAVAPSAAVMALLAPVAGAALAPLTTAENELAALVAPEGTLTEAYAWLITGIVLGLAAGTAVAGVVVEEAGWREAVLAGAAASSVGAVVAVARRGTLRAAPGTSHPVRDVVGA